MTVAPPPSGPVPYARAFALKLLEDMLRIRRLEEKSAELYGAGRIRGFLHLYIGEEAVAAGVLRPLDSETLLASVRKCRRAVVVDEGRRSGSLAAEVMARIAESAFYELDAPLARVCSEEVPMPYARHLEEAALPQPGKIVAAAKGLFR